MTRAQPDAQRADVALVERGLAPSRARAQAMILEGLVRSGDRRVDKPGDLIRVDAPLSVTGPDHPFVGRGGVKLAAALDAFAVDPRSLVCLDVGASTGGFTDCLLQRGAARVWAVDVGYGQLAWALRTDPRVRLLERANIRTLPREAVGDAIDLAVIDVSFISLRLVLPRMTEFVRPSGWIIALVKPQFEVGRGLVGRGGVVRDPVLHERAVQDVTTAAAALGLHCVRTIVSPIEGRDGNREYLIGLTVGEPPA
jgi:23S rRNA (cytidine1920-2'-O)/16S rRNA (cytidine1409-2'-O)-methyltransferase